MDSPLVGIDDDGGVMSKARPSATAWMFLEARTQTVGTTRRSIRGRSRLRGRRSEWGRESLVALGPRSEHQQIVYPAMR